MAHHKRKKSRRKVKCQICTPYKGLGNARNRMTAKERDQKDSDRDEMRSLTRTAKSASATRGVR